MISIIVAMSRNLCIGKDGKIPWHLKSDMEKFRDLTMGHPVIMGRKTWNSLTQKFKPLPGRTNIVMTRNSYVKFESTHIATTVKNALQIASKCIGSREIFVIGGAEIYNLFLPFADRMYMSIVNAEVDGDSYFPTFNNFHWSKSIFGSFEADENHDFSGNWYVMHRQSFPIVEPFNARNAEYRKHLELILQSDRCPFCAGGDTWNRQEIILENSDWIVTCNAHPLENTKLHILIIPRRHVDCLWQLASVEFESLLEIINQARQEFDLTGVVWYWREGNPAVTGATVQHLHLQGIVPQGKVEVTFGLH